MKTIIRFSCGHKTSSVGWAERLAGLPCTIRDVDLYALDAALLDGADALLIGMPRPFRGDEHSAIGKQPVAGPIRIHWLGFTGDGVADTVHHGGWDKAIHLYPQDHYDWWRERKPGHPLFETTVRLCASV